MSYVLGMVLCGIVCFIGGILVDRFFLKKDSDIVEVQENSNVKKRK